MARWWIGVMVAGLSVGWARGQAGPAKPPTDPGPAAKPPAAATAPQGPGPAQAPAVGPGAAFAPWQGGAPFPPGGPCPPVGEVSLPPPEECVDVGPCCDLSPRCYTNFEYLLWWFRKRQVPPLLTTGTITDPIPGALGQPNTRVLINRTFDNDNGFSGGRLTAGYWLDPAHSVAVEGSFFIFEERSDPFALGVDGGSIPLQVLARPFLNAATNLEAADPVNLPIIRNGTISFAQDRRFFGGDVNLRMLSCPSIFSFSRLSFLVGGRYLSLDEKLLARESLTDLPALPLAGNRTALSENFTTYNRFYGAQVGAGVVSRFGSILLTVSGKVGVGVNQQTAQLDAFTRVTQPSGVETTAVNRGLLIQPSNAGRYQRDQFSLVPEVNVNLGYDISDCIRVNVGYTYLAWTNVLEPGNLIDRSVVVQPVQATPPVGAGRPAFSFRNSDFWAQGFSAGIQFSY
jgi:Putative beta barrel porin-7 (BBP7)